MQTVAQRLSGCRKADNGTVKILLFLHPSTLCIGWVSLFPHAPMMCAAQVIMNMSAQIWFFFFNFDFSSHNSLQALHRHLQTEGTPEVVLMCEATHAPTLLGARTHLAARQGQRQGCASTHLLPWPAPDTRSCQVVSCSMLLNVHKQCCLTRELHMVH